MTRACAKALRKRVIMVVVLALSPNPGGGDGLGGRLAAPAPAPALRPQATAGRSVAHVPEAAPMKTTRTPVERFAENRAETESRDLTAG